MKVLKSNKPKSLLKFCNRSFEPDGSNIYINSFKDNKLWMSSPLKFNDPFDCAFNCGDISGKLVDFFKKSGQHEGKSIDFEQMRTIVSLEFNSIIKSTKTLSYVSYLSELENLKKITMLSHYANQHKEFCIEYETVELFNYYMYGIYGDSQDFKLYPVLYKKDNLFFDVDVFLSSGRDGAIDFFSRNIVTKSLDWKYENEWRILGMIDDESSNGFYISTIPAKSVYVGCKASDELIKTLKKICKKKDKTLSNVYDSQFI